MVASSERVESVPTRDVAEYLAEITHELAALARGAGLGVAASALETARRAAEEALRLGGLDEDAA